MHANSVIRARLIIDEPIPGRKTCLQLRRPARATTNLACRVFLNHAPPATPFSSILAVAFSSEAGDAAYGLGLHDRGENVSEKRRHCLRTFDCYKDI